MSEIKKGFTILIADDEKFNLDILASILSPLYNILVARNGTRALELAKQNAPDLILLDIIMPDMNGFEVITKLKETDRTVRIPVIFITGLTDPADEEQGFFLGAVDYITKPFNKAIVKARVNTHIQIIDQMRTIEQLGLMDTLTKVANRRGFDNRFEAEWGRSMREGTPLSFMLMDIDKFKVYNDTYGHHQGDNALKAFADVASHTSTRANDFFARWGGEEFVMLLPNTDIYGAAEVAEKLRSNIEEMTIPTEDGAATKVTVSIGVKSIIPKANTSLTDFQAKTDQALYRAKESGRNRVELCKE